MFRRHPFSRHAVRLAIAVGSLAAAACGDTTISGPSLDVNLSRVAGFDRLKAALVQARQEANGGFNLDMWAAVVDRNGLVVAVVFTGAPAFARAAILSSGTPARRPSDSPKSMAICASNSFATTRSSLGSWSSYFGGTSS